MSIAIVLSFDSPVVSEQAHGRAADGNRLARSLNIPDGKCQLGREGERGVRYRQNNRLAPAVIRQYPRTLHGLRGGDGRVAAFELLPCGPNRKSRLFAVCPKLTRHVQVGEPAADASEPSS